MSIVPLTRGASGFRLPWKAASISASFASLALALGCRPPVDEPMDAPPTPRPEAAKEGDAEGPKAAAKPTPPRKAAKPAAGGGSGAGARPGVVPPAPGAQPPSAPTPPGAAPVGNTGPVAPIDMTTRAEDRPIDVESYSLEATFDARTGTLAGTVSLALHATTADVRTALVDARVSRVDAVELEGTGPVAFQRDAASGTLAVSLPADLPLRGAGAPAVLKLRYIAEPSATGPLAPSGTGLGLVAPSPLDPVRVDLALASPGRGVTPTWMPCNDSAVDGAALRAAISVESGFEAVAPGTRTAVATTPDGRTLFSYVLERPAPPSSYALAAGALESRAGRTPSGTPVTLWTRRGTDARVAGASLSEAVEALAWLESRLGAFPYRGHSIVVAPRAAVDAHAASLALREETRLAAGAFEGAVRAAAHQWLGPVSWRDPLPADVLAEGLALTLAADARRWHEGVSRRPPWLGSSFAPGRVAVVAAPESETPHVRRVALEARAARVAWLLNQARAVAGEESFWVAFRSAVASRSQGASGPDAFLAAFEPALPEAVRGRLRPALGTAEVPVVGVSAERAPEGTLTGLVFTYSDPARAALVAPTFEWKDWSFWRKKATLEEGQAVRLSVSPSGVLVADPDDVLGDVLGAYGWGGDSALVARSRALTRAEDLYLLRQDTPATIEATLEASRDKALAPHVVASVLAGPFPEASRPVFAAEACRRARASVQGDPAAWGWRELAIAQVRLLDATPGLDSEALAWCDEGVLRGADASRFDSFLAAPESFPSDVIGSFARYDVAADPSALARVWSAVFLRGSSLAVRARAADALARTTETRYAARASAPFPAEAAPLRETIRAFVENAGDGRVLAPLVARLARLADPDALPSIANAIGKGYALDAETEVVCLARTLSGASGAPWQGFVDALGASRALLPAESASALSDAAACAPWH